MLQLVALSYSLSTYMVMAAILPPVAQDDLLYNGARILVPDIAESGCAWWCLDYVGKGVSPVMYVLAAQKAPWRHSSGSSQAGWVVA